MCARVARQEQLLTPGKLPHRQLERVLSSFRKGLERDKSVIVGPSTGIDSAVVRLSSETIAITSDPITLAGELSAYYCICVNANDLAVMGAKPEYMTISVLFPPCPASEISRTANQLAKYAKQFGITIVGGHTEITTTVNAPVLVATMFGRMLSKRIISSANVKPGDVIVMTKTAGIEATAIIAREKAKELEAEGISERKIRDAQKLLFNPGISILREASIAFEMKCSAMHDVTEGGVVSALWELSRASNLRIEVFTDKIPVLPITDEICRIWDINPLRVISSGALLIAISERKANKLIGELRRNGIEANIIARAVEGKAGSFDVKKRKKMLPCQDELVKIYI